MSISLLNLPAELRVAVFKYILADGIPNPPDYAGLRLSCRLLKHEFDHEFLSATAQHFASEVANIFGHCSSIRFSSPETFEETRRFQLFLPLSYVCLQDESGQLAAAVWPIDLIFSLGPHIRSVHFNIDVDIDMFRAQARDNLPSCTASSIGAACQQLDDLAAVERKSETSDEAMPINVMEVRWSKHALEAEAREFGTLIVESCEWMNFRGLHTWLAEQHGSSQVIRGFRWDLRSSK